MASTDDHAWNDPSLIQSSVHSQGLHINVTAVGMTDVGTAGGSVNQDSFFTLDLCHGTIVMGVFDGHGKELGQLASTTARSFFHSSFQAPDILERLEVDLEGEVRRLFAACHQRLFDEFRSYYDTRNVGLHEETIGNHKFLLKRAHRMQPLRSVQGGTSATIAMLIEGTRLWVANVGDSSLLFSGCPLPVRRYHSMAPSAPAFCRPALGNNASRSSSRHHTSNNQEVHDDSGDEDDDDSDEDDVQNGHYDIKDHNRAKEDADDFTHLTTILSGDHSAESLQEYRRMMGVTGTRQDKMKFLYDAPCENNCIERVPIFLHDPVTNDVRKVTSGGKYYKNVRHEWASMVSTPKSARFGFSDTLAFTRSLGDFHLHAYGLTFEPDIVEVDLAMAFHRQLGRKRIHDKDDGALSSSSSSTENVLVLASDGVWDVWHYEDVARFFLGAKTTTTSAGITSTTTVAASIEEEPAENDAHSDDDSSSRSTSKAMTRVRQFMDTNLRKAHGLFGEQADNMTVIACFVSATKAS